MKKVLIAAIVMSLAACNNSASDSETNADTSATSYDTSRALDTSAYNSGDSTGITRDTARTDRTDVRKRVDTGSRP